MSAPITFDPMLARLRRVAGRGEAHGVTGDEIDTMLRAGLTVFVREAAQHVDAERIRAALAGMTRNEAARWLASTG